MRARLSGLHTASKRLADGRIRVYAYAWRGGPFLAAGDGRTIGDANAALEAELGSAKALQLVAELRAQAKGEERAQSRRFVYGLVTGFFASPDFGRLSKSTQVAYRDYLERFRAEFGDWSVRLFERETTVSDLADWRDEMAGTPRAADYAIASVGRLFSWARERGLTRADPTRDLKKLHRADRSDIIWTEADIAAFCKEASAPLQWAVRLGAYTALRQGDLLRLPWGAVHADRIALRTSKRGRIAVVPLTREAQGLLDTIPRVDGALTVLTSSLGRPWTADGFRASFRRACIAAGIKKHFHDLRGTAVTRWAAAGHSPSDIARFAGWTQDRVEALLALYVSADVVTLDIMARMDRQRAVTNRVQTGSQKVEKKGRKD